MFSLHEELIIEVNEIQKMMDLLSSLFSIRTSFIYAIDDEQYTKEIAGSNGDYQEYCVLIQKELKHKCIACDRDKFREANEQKKRFYTNAIMVCMKCSSPCSLKIIWSDICILAR